MGLGDTFLTALLSASGTAVFFIFIILMNPEKVEKWGAITGYCINKLGGFFKFAHKRAVKLDLQGNINDYVKKLMKDIPTLEAEKVKIEYLENNQDRNSFIENNQVIVRLRRDDPDDLNFVHGAFLFVSTSLLFRIKRYISQSQRDALDLYVTTKLIEKEKPQRVDYFLEEYLHPKLKHVESDRKMYYDKLAIIDNSGFFYPVLLEELHNLGGKVFGGCPSDKIITEVRSLITFLEKVSLRNVGDENVDLDFHGEYCKTSIVIVGKALIVEKREERPYVKFIRNTLSPNHIDTVYLLGNIVNKKIIDAICSDTQDLYNTVRTHSSNVLLHREDGSTIIVKTYFAILKRIDASIVITPQ